MVRHRAALLTLLVGLAAPYRFQNIAIGPATVSLLDAVCLVAGGTLLLRWTLGSRILLGFEWRVLAPLSVLPALSVISMLWTRDPGSTVVAIVSSAESLVVFLLIITALRNATERQILSVGRLFLVLLLIPAAAMTIRVPGFEPQIQGVSVTSGDYLSFFSRLSHPFIGRSNNLATIVCFFFFPFLEAMNDSQQGKNRKATYWFLLVLVVLLMTLSRGVFVAVGVVFVIELVGRSSISAGTASRIVKLGAVAAAVLLIYLSVNSQASEFLSDRLRSDNLTSRFDLLDLTWGKVSERPILGHGAGVPLEVNFSTSTKHSHNTYLNQIFYFGIPLGVAGGLSLLLLRRRIASDQTKYANAVAAAWLTQLLVFFTQSSFEGSVLRVVIFGVLAWGCSLVWAGRSVPDGSPISKPALLPVMQPISSR